MSNLSAAKQLVKKKNWSADDLAQIIGYVLMGENPAFIADQLYVCELDVREVIQESLTALSPNNFHTQAVRLGFRVNQSTYQNHPKPKSKPPLPVWQKRQFCRVRNPIAAKACNVTAQFFGDPPKERSALSRNPNPPVNYQRCPSISLAPIRKGNINHV